MTKLISITITLFFLGLGFLLGVLNPDLVPFDLYWYQIELPISLLIVIAFAIGLLTAGVIFLSQTLKFKWQINRYKKTEKKQLNEIIALKKALLDSQKQTSQQNLSNKVPTLLTDTTQNN